MSEVHDASRLLALDLTRRLYSQRSRLGVVLRFKARCEWHDRERLRQLADDTAQPEHALRDELTRYLFDAGLNPLAEAVIGTSSRADVFDPSHGSSFYVEAKQYKDGVSLPSIMRAAFRQALDTAGNLRGSGYSADEAFIVLFRRGGPRAIFPVEPIHKEGLRWHFVLVNIAEPSEDASKNLHSPVEFTAGELAELVVEAQADSARSDSGAGPPPAGIS